MDPCAEQRRRIDLRRTRRRPVNHVALPGVFFPGVFAGWFFHSLGAGVLLGLLGLAVISLRNRKVRIRRRR